jgi:hypothetical protein
VVVAAAGSVADRLVHHRALDRGATQCAEEKNWIIVVAQQRPRDTVAEDRIGPFSTEEQCIEALESEVDFKAKSLQRLGNAVSAVRSSTSWNLRATTASGPETGQLTVQTTYSCVPA